MEPREYLRLFRRRWWLIAAIAAAGAAFAWITAPADVAPRVQRYEATHTLIVEPEARAWTPENPETIALLATQGEIPKRVASRLGLDDPSAALRAVDIKGDVDLAVVAVTATTSGADRSERYADVFAEELVAYLNEQEGAARQREVDRARAHAEDLAQRLAALNDQLANGGPPSEVLDERYAVLVAQYGDAESQYEALLAEPPADAGLSSLGAAVAAEVDAGIQPPRGRSERALILGTIGLLLGLAAVVVIDRLDVRIKTKEEAEAAFRLPVIAEIPRLRLGHRRAHEVLSHTQPASPVAEAYRGLRTTLLILRPTAIGAAPEMEVIHRRRASDRLPAQDDPARRNQQVYLVTSTRPSEGKTTSVVNLGAVFAEAGRSVLIIGADLRRPEIHAYLGAQREPGLTDILMGGGRRLRDVVQPTSIPGVKLVAAGAPVANPGELLLDAATVLREARELADVIVIDTTPMLSVNDAIQLMPGVDCVIVTCRSGRGWIEGARRVQEALARLHVPVAGVVLVGAPATPGVAPYYDGYQTKMTSSPVAALRRRLRRPRYDAFDPDQPSTARSWPAPTDRADALAPLAPVPAPPAEKTAATPGPRPAATPPAPEPQAAAAERGPDVVAEPDPWVWP